MKLLLVVCAVISLVVAYPGAAIAIEQDVVISAKDTYLASLLTIVNNIKVPNLNLGGKGYLNNNSFKISDSNGNSGIEFDFSDDDDFEVNISGLNAEFSCQNVYYDLWKFIKASGSLDAKITGISLQLNIGIST